MSSSISTVSHPGPCLLFVCRSSCKKLFTRLWTLKKVFSSVPIFFRGADAYYDHKRVFDYHITSTIKKRTQFSQLSEVRGSFVYFAYRKPQVNFVLFAGFRSTLAVCGTTLLVKSDGLAFLKIFSVTTGNYIQTGLVFDGRWRVLLWRSSKSITKSLLKKQCKKMTNLFAAVYFADSLIFVLSVSRSFDKFRCRLISCKYYP